VALDADAVAADPGVAPAAAAVACLVVEGASAGGVRAESQPWRVVEPQQRDPGADDLPDERVDPAICARCHLDVVAGVGKAMQLRRHGRAREDRVDLCEVLAGEWLTVSDGRGQPLQERPYAAQFGDLRLGRRAIWLDPTLACLVAEPSLVEFAGIDQG